MNIRTTLLIALGGAASLVAGCEAIGITAQRDYSDFRTFTLDRDDVLWFALSPGDILAADIAWTAPDQYRVQLTLVGDNPIPLADGEYECADEETPLLLSLDGTNGTFSCANAVEQPARLLTGAEVETMRQVFRNITVRYSASPPCGFVIVDPDMVSSYTWDGTTLSDFACDLNYVRDASVREIEAFLASLRGS